ncbi:hypothetical protein EYF80_047209 [Liparis tanakae]|uniref:Uncharacterized protein n=1 Tax=Liparis tanakae TaxID=230148 RepID=A0A4Z2FNX4_9TELE|nr:hypothetical protein EYF80_047209 [Liparis tanakae]
MNVKIDCAMAPHHGGFLETPRAAIRSGVAKIRSPRSYLELLDTDRCGERFSWIEGACVLSVYWLFQINGNTAAPPQRPSPGGVLATFKKISVPKSQHA